MQEQHCHCRDGAFPYSQLLPILLVWENYAAEAVARDFLPESGKNLSLPMHSATPPFYAQYHLSSPVLSPLPCPLVLLSLANLGVGEASTYVRVGLLGSRV